MQQNMSQGPKAANVGLHAQGGVGPGFVAAGPGHGASVVRGAVPVVNGQQVNQYLPVQYAQGGQRMIPQAPMSGVLSPKLNGQYVTTSMVSPELVGANIPVMTNAVTKASGTAAPNLNVASNGRSSSAGSGQYHQQYQRSGQPMSRSQSSASQGGSTRSKMWQSDADVTERQRMILKIVHLLKQRRKDPTEEWLQKLPQMARRLESSLYRQARSLEEYMDGATLKKRLHQLAVAWGVKAQQVKQQQTAAGSGREQPRASLSRHASTEMHAQQQARQFSNGHGNAMYRQTNREAPINHESGTKKTFVNMNDVNPYMNVAAAPHHPQPHHAKSQAQAAAQGQLQIQQPAGGGQMQSKKQPQTPEQRKALLRQQQQRLLLLRHASKCPYNSEEGQTCTVTQHCAAMKKLWSHIAECKDQRCQTPHCVSSRYVLSHYHRCKEVQCAVCAPVREAIQRSRQKQQKQAQMEQQRQQQIAEQQKLLARQKQRKESVKRQRSDPTDKSKMQNAALAAAPDPKRIRTDPSGGSAPSSLTSVAPHVPPGSMPAVSGSKPEGSGSTGAAPGQTRQRIADGTSILDTLPTADIQAHMKSLEMVLQLKGSQIKQYAMPLLKKLMDHGYGWIFNTPVDPKALNLPDYFEIIKKPMDLGTIKRQLDQGSYKCLTDFADDVKLTFNNATTYNAKETEVHKIAKILLNLFEREYKTFTHQLAEDQEQAIQNGEACMLCCKSQRNFELPNYYCNGASCNGARIRRSVNYYHSKSNQYHWCGPCYNQLKDGEPIYMLDGSHIYKSELKREKHNKSHEEPWVACDDCQGWIHQICAMFNGRTNSQTRRYYCPKCVIRRRMESNAPQPSASVLDSSDLQKTPFTTFLEERLNTMLEDLYENISKDQDIPLEQVEKCPPMTLRMVSNVEKVHTVREKFLKRYRGENGDYPEEFPVRSKCIVLFQKIDGVDVILFAMYVYEYGHKCPEPNRRRVYISYLDSVHYLRPRHYRTEVYHEILASYLEYVRIRGFHTAHIWACPPLKGDDYIFYAHPETQKTPRDERLRQWYQTMIQRAKHRGHVHSVSNLYDEYFTGPDADMKKLPYFEGDYWVGEAENIIKELEEEGPEAKEAKGKKGAKRSKKSQSKSKALRSGGPASAEDANRDVCLEKLGSTIQPMKDAFIVVHLRPPSYKDAVDRKFDRARARHEARERGETVESSDEDEDKLETDAKVEAQDVKPSVAAEDDGQTKPKSEGVKAKVKTEPADEGEATPGDEAKDTSGAATATSGSPLKAEESKAASQPSEAAQPSDAKDTAEAMPASTEANQPSSDDATTGVVQEGGSDDGPKEMELTTDVSPPEEKSPVSVPVGKDLSTPSVKDVRTEPSQAGEGKSGAIEAEPQAQSTETPASPSETAADAAVAMDLEKSEGGSTGPAPESTPAGKGASATDTTPSATAEPTESEFCGVCTEGEEVVPTVEGKESTQHGDAEGSSASAAAAAAELDLPKAPEDGSKKGAQSSDATGSSATPKASGDSSGVAAVTDAATKTSSSKFKSEPEPEQQEDLATILARQRRRLNNVKIRSLKDIRGKISSDTSWDEKADATVDPDLDVSYDIIDTRQQFLNLCQVNHYQFDQLRRAKHTTMLILYHLHNPHVEKFLPTCSCCGVEISTDYRRQCTVCKDVQFCEVCYKTGKHGHPHPLKREANNEEVRKQRQRSMQLHMKLLSHAASCPDVQCKSPNCMKMRKLLSHHLKCEDPTCVPCRRIVQLLSLHARQCRDRNCTVPRCNEYKIQVRALQEQQRRMDDRRRQAMNQLVQNRR